MRKIAIIAFNISLRSGTERAVCNLANLLVESERYSVSIISVHSILDEVAYSLNNNICVYHFGLPQYNNKIFRLQLYRSLIKKLNQLYREINFDIILGTTHAINCTLFFVKGKAKIVACEHFVYLATPIFARIIRKIIYPFLNTVVVLTSTGAKYYSFHKSVIVIPNSLSFQSERQSELTNKIILAVGRLTHIKGFDLLIKAISLIKFECEGWELRIVGSGADKDRLEKEIKTLGLDGIIKICQPTDAIIQEYLKASIFVLSSKYEALPMVMLEAQSCGLPIVSFDCPEGPAEIVRHDENGFLVKNGNIEELSKAIRELMFNHEKRIQFGKNALQNISKYKPEQIFVLWNNLLETL